MAEKALSTIGAIFGWGLGTMTTPPTSWLEIEECISIGGVELTQDKLDATPLKSKRKIYIAGHEDTGGELPTVFNYSNTFKKQWNEMLDAYEGRSASQVMWFCVWLDRLDDMFVYIVEPGSISKPEIAVGNVLQSTITNTLVDLPDDIPAVRPTEPTATV